MSLNCKVLITCEVMVELPNTMAEEDTFKATQEWALQEGIDKIKAALLEAQKQGVSVGCKFDIRNPRMKVMFLGEALTK